MILLRICCIALNPHVHCNTFIYIATKNLVVAWRWCYCYRLYFLVYANLICGNKSLYCNKIYFAGSICRWTQITSTWACKEKNRLIGTCSISRYWSSILQWRRGRDGRQTEEGRLGNAPSWAKQLVRLAGRRAPCRCAFANAADQFAPQ
jgi:hypothetical protein